MDSLIPIMNRLQDVLNAVGSNELDLPQIVVVGSQSSGKSSVLESLVGRDFLPRGTGIVTRRPLVLQLNNLPSLESTEANKSPGAASSSAEVPTAMEWGEFDHIKPRKTFSNFKDICDEIQRETNRVAGSEKGVTSVPITLKIFSPRVLSLTLVDLPGITNVPVAGQPANIADQIRNMVLDYIKNPSALILAVSGADTDLANSDALQMAKKVDPEGKRTIGVLTKVDLMDKGTDVIKLMESNPVPLDLGYIAVRNRSQRDILSLKPMDQALKEEEEFFAARYPSLVGKSGIRYLATTLSQTLKHHIRAKIPELRQKVSKSLVDASKELASFGTVPTGESKSAFILEMIRKFADGYRQSIDGQLAQLNAPVPKSVAEIEGGARISWLFHNILTPALHSIDPLQGLTDLEIHYAIRNATGPRIALFIPESAFELLVKRQIVRLERPSLSCVDHVFAELKRIVSGLENTDLSRFEALKSWMLASTDEYLHSCRAPTKQMISDILAIENAYINTAHPDFANAVSDVINESDKQQRKPASRSSAPQAIAPSSAQPKKLEMAQLLASAASGTVSLSERDKQEVIWVKKLLVSYFAIVRMNIQDAVPKTIVHLLVNKSKHMQHELNVKMANISSEEQGRLLDESPECGERRKALEDTLTTLQQAKDILSTVNQDIT